MSNDNKSNSEKTTRDKPEEEKKNRLKKGRKEKKMIKKLGQLIILILLACVNTILSVCSTVFSW